MRHEVTFSSAFATDQFGFVGKGTVTLGEGYIELSGRRSWKWYAKLGIFLLVTLVPLLLIGFALGLLPALLLITYVCASPASLVIEKSSISEIKRKGKRVTFKATDPATGKVRKGLMDAKTEQEAASIEEGLRGVVLPTATHESFLV